jgi:hypothetical protein
MSNRETQDEIETVVDESDAEPDVELVDDIVECVHCGDEDCDGDCEEAEKDQESADAELTTVSDDEMFDDEDESDRDDDD